MQELRVNTAFDERRGGRGSPSLRRGATLQTSIDHPLAPLARALA